MLLEVPSCLFYGGSLIEKGDRALVDSLCNWEGLPQTTAYTAASTTDASAVSASDDMIAYWSGIFRHVAWKSVHLAEGVTVAAG